MRVGVVGAAGHYPYVIQGIRETEGAELCAVAPGCPDEGLDLMRERYGIASAPDSARQPRLYESYRDMLDHEALDVVAVNPFFYLHEEVTREALVRKIPVFSEKPLSLTLDGLASLREAREAAGVPVGIMLDYRYVPSCAAAHAIVRAGGIGKPTVGYCQKSYRRGTRPDFYRRRETFGGIIPWIGIHAIDWFRWVSGCEYVAVSAQHVKLHAPDYPGMEDAATCLFELDNGGSVVMSFDFLRPAGAPSHGDDRMRLAGDKGVVEFRGSDSLEWISTTGVESSNLGKPEHGLFADFLLSLTDRSHVCRISTDDAFRVTEIALKAREAADRGMTIALS